MRTKLSELVFDALGRRGATRSGRWIFGPLPISRVALEDGLRERGTQVVFIRYLEAEGRGAWRTLLAAIHDAAAGGGLDPRTVVVMLEATKETRTFWERAGFSPFSNLGEAYALFTDLDPEEGLTPMRARLSELPRRPLPNPLGCVGGRPLESTRGKTPSRSHAT